MYKSRRSLCVSNNTVVVPLDHVDSFTIIILPLLVVVAAANQLGNMNTYIKVEHILPWVKIMVVDSIPRSPVTVPRVLFERKIVVHAILNLPGFWWVK